MSWKGRQRTGSGSGPERPPPAQFTDQSWQAARTDGELLWILKNGSPGTDMAPFIPLILTEEEAWQVLLYVRAFAAITPAHTRRAKTRPFP